MNKIPLQKWDLNLYYEKLPSGLEVYVVKKENVNNVTVQLTTKYGSDTIEFVPRGAHKMKKFPLGIAHFLEHQMFNMEDNTDPMEVFGSSGTNCNAFTNNIQTTYLFDGMHQVIDNIIYLLHYVSSPFFTDESVEKEKGIILSEEKMYLNYPDTIMDNTILKNTFKVFPSKYPVIGTETEIKKTTKEDLQECYDTFYHPSNMFLTVVGNVNPVEIIDTVKKSELNQNHLKDKPQKIRIKEYDEPNKVVKEYQEVDMDVVIPKVAVNYKLGVKPFSLEEKRKLYLYLLILLDSKIGATSLFLEEMRNEEIVTESIDYNIHWYGEHYLMEIYTSTKYYEEFVSRVKQEFSDLSISEEDFERKKKVLISSYIYSSDNIYNISNRISSDILLYGEVMPDYYQFLKDLNYYEMKELLKKISFKNQNVVVIRKK